MQVARNTVVTFHYSLAEIGSEPFEDSHEGEPMVYLHGAGNILKALEDALEGKNEGDQVEVSLQPEQAYGPRREDAVQRVPVKHLVLPGKKTRLKPGMLVGLNTRDGVRNVRVAKAGKFTVDVDTNHPLAGRALKFNIDIMQVREASEAEISHGHVHAGGDCDH